MSKNKASGRIYLSTLPVAITVGDDGTVSVDIDLTDISEAVYDFTDCDPAPTECQHAEDITAAVAAKRAGTVSVTILAK